MKATALAPSNIAFIKYWGKKDEKLRIPLNGSISVNLSNLTTTTTVEFDKELLADEISINGKKEENTVRRVIEHLNRVRNLAKINFRAKVMSINSFPASSGLASSASGFAALTLAATKAIGLKLDEKQLTILARLGSGSACRSIPDGFVEWFEGESSETSYAKTIFPADYFDIAVVSLIVSKESKILSTTEGQKKVIGNPFMKIRLSRMEEKINMIKKFIERKDLDHFGKLSEEEALEFHSMTLTSNPPVFYWLPQTVKIIHLTWQWRKEGLPVYFTIDAGPNVFLIIKKDYLEKLKTKLKESNVQKYIVNYPAGGVRLITKHLF